MRLHRKRRLEEESKRAGRNGAAYSFPHSENPALKFQRRHEIKIVCVEWH